MQISFPIKYIKLKPFNHAEKLNFFSLSPRASGAGVIQTYDTQSLCDVQLSSCELHIFSVQIIGRNKRG